MGLNNIIKCDQTAYVKGRHIGESIRLVREVSFFTTRGALGSWGEQMNFGNQKGEQKNCWYL